MNIIVVGSLAFDQIMVYPGAFADNIMPDKLHVLSLSFLVDKLHKNYGGVAGNICYNLGLLGKNPICLSSVGKDADDYVSFLHKNGVNTNYVNVEKNDYTASFVVLNDKKDCQIAGFYPGAMHKDDSLSIADIHEKGDNFLVVAPTMPEAMAKHINYAVDYGIRYMYSPAQQIPRLKKEDMIKGVKNAEILIGSDYELALLEKSTGMSKEEMLDSVNIMITTIGARGSKIEQSGQKEIIVGVAKIKELNDPTGSGDAYIAGFLSGYLYGKSLVESAQMGATVAAYAVESFGTTAHSFSKVMFENRLRENFG